MSERQWGTVREDYSADGDAWNYFPHDHARSRAYRWGEDGIGGFCDAKQHLCLAVALWNGKDPILKERMFGLSNREGNHGEDVKELYYYLDAVPTYSYARMLYKYPQAAFPYDLLVQENARRDRQQPEFEIIDTGIFDADRYFDVDIEYAKAGADDILLRLTVTNRGPEEAAIHVLPQVWFRNTWSWFTDRPKPSLERAGDDVVARHETLGAYAIHFDEAGRDQVLRERDQCRQNCSAAKRPDVCTRTASTTIWWAGRKDAVGSHKGTKAAGIYRRTVAAGASTTIRVRLSLGPPKPAPFAAFRADLQPAQIRGGCLLRRAAEQGAGRGPPPHPTPGLRGHPVVEAIFLLRRHRVARRRSGATQARRRPPQGTQQRVGPCHHGRRRLDAGQMGVSLVRGLGLGLSSGHARLSRSGGRQASADPARPVLVHASRTASCPPTNGTSATSIRPCRPGRRCASTRQERRRNGKGDRKFLERVFTKLLLNFTWWVNRKDPRGLNVFEGGFLGMDNIGVFDRSAPLPVDGMQVQSDGTSWMAMYSLNMLRIAIELAQEDDAYQDIATKFFEHFLMIGGAMTNLGGKGLSLWDDTDNFFYDWLVMSNGEATPLRVRSLVGLIPAFAVETIDAALLKNLPSFTRQRDWYLRYRPKLAVLVSRWNTPGADDTRLLAIARAFRASKVLGRVLDKNEFLSDYGIRSLSRYHLDHPYVFESRQLSLLRGQICPGRIGQRSVRRKFQLARADLDADQLPVHRKREQVRQVLRRQFPRGMPGRIRRDAVAEGDRR